MLVGLKHNNCNNNKRSERGLFTQTNCTHSKGGNVTSAGWQVTFCDPIWHVSFPSCKPSCKLLYSVYSICLLDTMWRMRTASTMEHWPESDWRQVLHAVCKQQHGMTTNPHFRQTISDRRHHQLRTSWRCHSVFVFFHTRRICLR